MTEYDKVMLAHGGGGSLSNKLIEKMFFSEFDNKYLNKMHDGAVFQTQKGKMAFSTDSFVIQPIFFPGGNIGELAVYGTVNDLACCGAVPQYLSLGFILEEGLPMDDLWKIVQSIKHAADKAGVLIVTGDTKVVEKGKGDKIFINTTGVGIVKEGVTISPKKCKVGDKIIVSGTIADHGISIMSLRAGLEFETSIKSDTAPLNHMIREILEVSDKINVLRDPTRGGLASTLNEIASSSGKGIMLYEDKIPVREDVKGVCEILGLDPLYVANEGKMLVFVAEEDTERVLKTIRQNEYGKNAAVIGEVEDTNDKIVKLKTSIGTTRIVDMISGEQLPRIC
ncbi:MAG: hydrogenase expression/formation protein HypE [Chlorobi bacterium]|nr:hydrogenase expression/formation protein HypE [Chlorobiota bacterium]